MRSLGGLVLLSGIGVGLFVYLPAPVDYGTSLDQVHRAATARSTRQPAPTQTRSGSRSFSPGISLTSVEPSGAGSKHRASVKVVRPATTAHVQGASLSGWQTALAATGATLQTQTQEIKPTDPKSRYKLVVELQRKLKERRCYFGRIDGSWGSGSKYAMKSYMDRANAALPFEEPNFVMLTLLQSQKSSVRCDSCPADQTLSNGRCVPQSTIAQAAQPNAPQGASARASLTWQTTTTSTTGTTIAATAPTTTTAAPAAQPLFTPLPSSVVSTEPLPGRMAIGGPRALPPVNSVYSQPSAAGTADVVIAPNNDVAGLPPAASQAEPRKPKKPSYKRSRRRDGPGTPRYNLMLSLGGVY